MILQIGVRATKEGKERQRLENRERQDTKLKPLGKDRKEQKVV